MLVLWENVDSVDGGHAAEEGKDDSANKENLDIAQEMMSAAGYETLVRRARKVWRSKSSETNFW